MKCNDEFGVEKETIFLTAKCKARYHYRQSASRTDEACANITNITIPHMSRFPLACLSSPLKCSADR